MKIMKKQRKKKKLTGIILEFSKEMLDTEEVCTCKKKIPWN